MARTFLLLVVVASLIGASAARQTLAATTSAVVKRASFYDALVADKANHKLILDAINKDANTKKMLQAQLNVTAFVPTDKAFVQAAIKYKLGLDPTKMMSNTCLINAILRYHIITPGLKLDQLKKLTTKNTMLVVSSTVNGQKKTVAKTLRFKPEGGNVRVFSGASSALLVAPKNVIAGKGIMHNINAVLLPTGNITQLEIMTGCKATL